MAMEEEIAALVCNSLLAADHSLTCRFLGYR